MEIHLNQDRGNTMPGNDVILHLRTNSNSGYTATEPGSKGTVYYYKYTGGNSGNSGNNDYDFDTPQSSMYFEITLQYPENQSYIFQPSNTAFNNKSNSSDLSGTNTDTVITVTNTRQTHGTWNYGAKVVFNLAEDSKNGETFECDPVITNRAAHQL
jgi:hypothetical protein